MSAYPADDERDTDRDAASTPPAASTPLQRLQLSRERMRRYLLPAVRKPRDAEAGLADKIGGKLDEWRDHPLIGAVIDAVQGWWAHHPLRSVADIGSTAARELAEPLVRRHPVACVAGALVLGALAMRVKPWRWILRPALFAGLTTQVVSRLLSDAPMEFVLNALMKLKRQAPPADPVAPETPDTPDTPAAAPDVPAAASAPVAANDPADVDAPAASAVPTLDSTPTGAPAPMPEVAIR